MGEGLGVRGSRYNYPMSDTPSTPHRIVVVAHPTIPDALTEAASINGYLKKHGLEAAYGTLDDASLRKRILQGDLDLLIAVGGDGTMLRASHLCAPCNV